MVTRSAPPCLLDANLLLALAWPQHVHHGLAHDWFARAVAKGWATCAITQMAFVRISCNPRLTVAGVTPDAAAALLAQMTAHPGHRFLSEAPPLPGFALFGRRRLLGHGQVTDAYLLSLAMHHGFRFATLDRGVLDLLDEPERKRWIAIPTPA